MNSLPRITPANIFEDFWNVSTIAWAAIWALILHAPYFWKHRGMIVHGLEEMNEGMMTFTYQQYLTLELGLFMILHTIERKSYTKYEIAYWKERGILFRKTNHGYRWRNAN